MKNVEREQQAVREVQGERVLAFASIASTVANIGYISIAPGDQRVLVLLMFSIVAGMVMLTGDKSAPYGMGAMFGAAVSTAVAVSLALAGFSPHDFHPNR